MSASSSAKATARRETADPGPAPGTGSESGTLAEIGEVLDQILERNRHIADELARVCRQVTGRGGWTSGWPRALARAGGASASSPPTRCSTSSPRR